jgi:hypothetical protein
MRSGLAYERAMSAPLTAASGCSSSSMLPTPSAALAHGGQTSRSGDRRDEKLLPGILADLETPPRLLPTPTAADNPTAGGKHNSNGHASSLTGTLKLLPTPEAKNSHAGQDYARATREHSGGHDLVTALMLTEASSSLGESSDPQSSNGAGSSGEDHPGLW